MVGGKPIRCLLDSGCERSVISRRLVPNFRVIPSRYILTTANRTDLLILGDMNLKFMVDGHKFKANVSVSHEVDEFLLRSDLLSVNHAKWDFAERLVSENCEVPAKHEANVPVKHANGDISHPLGDWTIEPHKLDGVMAVRTFVSGGHTWAVACICNYSDKPPVTMISDTGRHQSLDSWGRSLFELTETVRLGLHLLRPGGGILPTKALGTHTVLLPETA